MKFCKDCVNCRIKQDLVFCRCGHFNNCTLDDIIDYIAEDFDCEDYEADTESVD